MNQDSVKNNYLERIKVYDKEYTILSKRSDQLSMVRFAIMVLFIINIYLFRFQDTSIVVSTVLFWTIVFIWVVLRQLNIKNQASRIDKKRIITQNELNLIDGQSNLYYDGSIFIDDKHHYSSDLDIFGPHSLYGLLNRTKTFFGIHYLEKYLSAFSSLEVILKRQTIIKELENDYEWRLELNVNLFDIVHGESSQIQSRLKRLLQFDLKFIQNKAIQTYVKIQPIIWATLILLLLFKVNFASNIAGFLFIIHLLWIGKHYKSVGQTQQNLSRLSSELEAYHGALQTISKRDWSTSWIQEEMIVTQQSSITCLSELNSIIKKLDYRLNIIVGTILNGMLLWDFRVLHQLNHWNVNHGNKIITIIDEIGKIEALASLATFAYNHPHFGYPTITDQHFSLKATSIVHPLLRTQGVVSNNFELDQNDLLNLITGSNMSGKSTFIRTLGLNMVLAYSGTKVTAKSLHCGMAKVVTYMRIKDSLEESVSSFKAEIDRIKLIFDYIKSGEKCIFLIDEMLRGTNSKDKLAGSIAIAKKLLHEKVYAVIATHDIKMAEELDQHEHSKNYYFDISFEGDDLHFDYKINPGICRTTNASFLLKKIGIE